MFLVFQHIERYHDEPDIGFVGRFENEESIPDLPGDFAVYRWNPKGENRWPKTLTHIKTRTIKGGMRKPKIEESEELT